MLFLPFLVSLMVFSNQSSPRLVRFSLSYWHLMLQMAPLGCSDLYGLPILYMYIYKNNS